MPVAARRPRGLPVPAIPIDAHDAAAALALRRFRVVFNAVKSHFQRVEQRAGLGGAQVWALSLVQAQPGIGIGRLAQAMDIHQTTASNLARSLVAQDMLEVRKEGPDRRAVQLHLRPAGLRVLRRAPGPFAGVLPEALARLDARTLKRLNADLAALIAELHADERAAQVPLAQM